MLRVDRYVFEEATAIGEAAEEGIFVTVVVEVREDTHIYARHIFRQARLESCVGKSTVAAVSVKTWTRAVGEEDVVPTIVVIIDRGDAGWTILDDLECLRLPCG